MTSSSLYISGAVKAGTLALLAGLLLFLGSPTHHASLSAYLALFGIILLQAAELLYPTRDDAPDAARRLWVLRLGILLQLLLASFLVAVTDGHGSIYELVYLMPILSASIKLSGREVALVVGAAVAAMVGFILTGERLTTSITKVKEFQDATAAILYFVLAGLLTYLFAKSERDQRVHYQAMAARLVETNTELSRVQVELTQRLADLTEMEERVRQITQTAALGELAAQVAHEVRNPLGIIKGASDMLAARVSDPALKRHIAVLLEEVDRLNTVVDGILRMGSPLRLQRATVSLQEVVKAVAQAAKGWAATGLHRIDERRASEPLIIAGDRDLLYQALSNLARNAFQAMPSGGTLVFEVDRQGDEARLLMTDTGIGLSDTDLARLGESFFSKRPGGIGLGFGFARRVISEHGGRIAVSSVLGQGTSVTISLPLGRVACESPADEPVAATG